MGKQSSGTGREQGNGGGDDVPAMTEREGYKVYPGKEAWADELFRTCRRLGLPPDRKGRPNLRALAVRINKKEYTLIARIGNKGDPELETLRLLESKAELPVVRSLLTLGVLTRAGLEAELGVALQDLPSQEVAALANLTAALPVLPRDALELLFDALLELRGPNPGNTHGPTPTAKDRS
jgi:hypothetical protein